jgi:lysophospholipase L1-like esterase
MYLPYTANQGPNFPAPPDANADGSRGFPVGFEWFDFVANRTYICVDNSLRAAIWVGSVAMDNAKRMRAIMDTAHEVNPYQRDVMSTPPTVAVGATSDGTLTVNSIATGGVLTPFALNQVAWYGGVPNPVLTAYACMPVTTVLPSTNGNIGSGFADKNQWASAFEFSTDSDKVQLTIFMSNAVKVMLQVDGQYVDKVGVTGLGAANADTFITMTFASRKPRRIRVLVPSLPSKGPCLIKTIRTTATCTVWKPSQSQVLRCGWFGDSYSEGTNGAATVYPVPNAAWNVIACELLGIRDCRQLAVGQTGYLATATGTRSKLRDLIPLVAYQGPYDVIVIAHGYNDSSNTPAAVQAEALACYQLLRKMYPNTPIVVLGCQAGNAGPNAAQIACEGAIAAAVTQFNDPFCKFAPVSTAVPTWLNGTGKLGAPNSTGNSDVYVDPDGAHPSLAGNEFLGFRAAGAVRGAITSMIT